MKTLVNNALSHMRGARFKRFVSIAAPLVALLYLAIGLLAYVRLWPGSTSFFSASSFSGVTMRAATIGLLVFLSLAIVISFRPIIQWQWLIAFGILMACNYIMVVASPHAYSTLYQSEIYKYGELFVTSVSNRSLLISSLSSFADFVFGLCFLVVLPKAFFRVRQVLLVLLPYIAFMVFQCLYAIVVQKDYFINLFSGRSPYYYKALVAMFSSKQELGVFLCPAFCLCPICIWLIRRVRCAKWIKWIGYVGLILSAFLLFAISLFSLCKTAILGNGFALLFTYAGVVLWFFKTKRRVQGFALCLAFVLLSLAVVLFLAVPAFHESGAAKSLYDVIANQILGRMDVGSHSRINILLAYFSAVPLPNLFFGFGKGLSDIYVRSLAPILRYGVHTGAVNYLANYGVISFFLVSAIFFFFLKKRASKMWASPMISCALLGIFAAAMVLNIAELEILLFSSSITVFMFNFTIFVFGESALVNPDSPDNHILAESEVEHA